MGHRNEEMNRELAYDPGRLPSRPAPRAGDSVEFRLPGLPPFKDESFSIRNPKHRFHDRFVALRTTAIGAMAGRTWSHGAIGLDLELHAPSMDARRALVDYVGGVMDSLDGSHGPHFTYLPIAYNDDCQICEGDCSFHPSKDEWYSVRIRFLTDIQQQPT